VVIAVIGILASLLLPALSKARSRAQQTDCANNLKQWGVATIHYVTDNDDLLPQDGAPNGTSTNAGWYVDLPRLIDVLPYNTMPWRTNAAASVGKSLWICPSNPRRSNGNNLFHYCLNLHINGSGAGNSVAYSSLRDVSSLVWMFDNGGLAAVAQQNNVHTTVHNNGANILFLDGHVTRHKNLDYWDFTLNQGRTNNPDIRWIP